MVRTCALLTVAWVLACATVVAAEKEKKRPQQEPAPPLHGDFESDKAVAATERLGKAFWPLVERYHTALEYAKGLAARKGDVEETKRLDAALGGECVDDFTTPHAKSAHKAFQSGLERACKTYTYSLKPVLRDALLQGKNEEAEHIQAVISALEEATTAATKITRGVTVYANKDWQKSGTTVKKGTTVQITATGEWSPGAQRRKAKGKLEHVYGDADTYNVQARLGGKTKRGGKSWCFTAPADGELEFRMVPMRWRARLAEAKGSLSLRLNIDSTTAKGARSLESIVRSLVPAKDAVAASKETSKPESKPTPAGAGDGTVAKTTPKPQVTTQTVQLKATRNWQDSLVNVPQGATVTIRAEGEWSPGFRKTKENNAKKRWTRLKGTADVFNMEGMIGNTVIGTGGANATFEAKIAGVLYLRMAPKCFRRTKGEPEGSLTLTITVTPAAGAG